MFHCDISKNQTNHNKYKSNLTYLARQRSMAPMQVISQAWLEQGIALRHCEAIVDGIILMHSA
eukprot:1365014-Amorphochlora_amoeboformis.AAC.1